MNEKEKWYAMKAYSLMKADAIDVFDFFFLREEPFKGNLSQLTQAIDCEYLDEQRVRNVLTGGLTSQFFCVYWEHEDKKGEPVGNSDITQVFMLDTVWETLLSIGKEFIGEV